MHLSNVQKSVKTEHVMENSTENTQAMSNEQALLEEHQRYMEYLEQLDMPAWVLEYYDIIKSTNHE